MIKPTVYLDTTEISIPQAISIRLESTKFFVQLADGREIGVPYAWFPRLAAATQAQREQWRLIGKGTGIHWEPVDEDISVRALLHIEWRVSGDK